MTARLHQHASACVNKQHSGVGGACASDHVARVLLVARRVGHNKLALVSAEESVGHINSYALLTLRGQAIHQKREVNLLALGSVLVRFFFQRCNLIFKQQVAFPQQAANQRALAVIHAATSDKAQQANFALVIQKFFQGLNSCGAIDGRANLFAC